MNRDPYAILGVTPEASKKEIKSAYRKLCRLHHPDRNQGDKQASLRLQEVIRAYEAISSGAASAQPADPGNFPDLESERSGSGRLHTVEIDFRQAFTGTSHSAPVTLNALCQTCGGSGSAPGHRPRICGSCQGSGRHQAGKIVAECSSCSGRGFLIEVPCPDCRGGRREKTITIDFQIPAGVWDGYRMKASAPGAVVDVIVKVSPSPVFERQPQDPQDLHIEVPISYSEAALGAKVTIPTPEKLVGLKIPEGTASGRRFRISGQGMPLLDKPGRGDLFVTTVVSVPEELSSKQRRLLAELAKHEDPELRSSLFQKLS